MKIVVDSLAPIVHSRGMKAVINKIKRLIRQVAGLFPTKLPTGRAEFEAWCQSIEDTYTLPCSSQDVRFVLSAHMPHMGPTVAYKSKFYFTLVIGAAATKQIAGAIFFDIKTKQIEAQKAAEATAKAVADGPK